jgi:hypothetical protein
MFVLDTNVLSEIMDPEGTSQVLAWIDPLRKDDLFTTALNQAEILYGIAIMPEGRKRNGLIVRADAMFSDDLRGRILPFDERAAEHFAAITARRKHAGRPVGIFDSQIAAIARAHEMTIVTRNTKHFEDCDVPLIDPWST